MRGRFGEVYGYYMIYILGDGAYGIQGPYSTYAECLQAGKTFAVGTRIYLKIDGDGLAIARR